MYNSYGKLGCIWIHALAFEIQTVAFKIISLTVGQFIVIY